MKCWGFRNNRKQTIGDGMSIESDAAADVYTQRAFAPLNS